MVERGEVEPPPREWLADDLDLRALQGAARLAFSDAAVLGDVRTESS
jgi:hypothetical protein